MKRSELNFRKITGSIDVVVGNPYWSSAEIPYDFGTKTLSYRVNFINFASWLPLRETESIKVYSGTNTTTVTRPYYYSNRYKEMRSLALSIMSYEEWSDLANEYFYFHSGDKTLNPKILNTMTEYVVNTYDEEPVTDKDGNLIAIADKIVLDYDVFKFTSFTSFTDVQKEWIINSGCEYALYDNRIAYVPDGINVFIAGITKGSIYYINEFLSSMILSYYGNKWLKIKNLLEQEYSVTLTAQSEKTYTPQAKATTTITHATRTDTNKYGKTDTQSGSIDHGTSGSVKQTEISSTTNNYAGFNDTSYQAVNQTKTPADGNTNETSFTNYKTTDTFNSYKNTAGGTDSKTIAYTGTDSKTLSFDGSNTTSETKALTNTPDLINKYFDVYKNVLFDIIRTDIDKLLTIPYYDYNV